MNDLQAVSPWSRLAAFAQRHNGTILALVLAIYFVPGVPVRLAQGLLSRRVVHHLPVARRGPAEVWANLRDVPEPNPPATYLLTNWSVAVLGENHLAVRLPSILAFGALVLCVYCFAARRCGPACAWLSVLFLLANNVTAYAYEARPLRPGAGLRLASLFCAGKWQPNGVAPSPSPSWPWR